jgi:hypothetical protein
MSLQPVAHRHTLFAFQLRPAIRRGRHLDAADLVETWLILIV